MNTPQDVLENTEQALLSAVLLDPSSLERIGEIVVGSHFENRILGRAFDLVGDMYAAGWAVGEATVLVPELKKAGLLEDLGGAGAVGQLFTSGPKSENVEYHAREVRRLHQCRKLIGLGNRIARMAAAADADPSQIVERIESDTRASIPTGAKRAVSLSDAMERLADRMEADRQRGGISGVTTGIESLDQITGGMLPGELIVIGARTSIGKTAFAMQSALDVACSGASVLVVSLEMLEFQLSQRIAARRLNLSLFDQRSGDVTENDISRVRGLAREYVGVPLSLIGDRRVTMSQIRGHARAAKASGGLDLLVVDYLQLVTPSDPRKQRHEQVSECSNGLKSLAMELNCPVVALAQLNRKGEEDKPMLSQLRESGSIEQDADSVWFVHRGHRESTEATLIVAKQRQGKVGEITLEFDGDRCEFSEPNVSEPTLPDPVNTHSEFDEWSG